MDSPRLAACYIRVSTEDQTEYSPDAQRRALDAYAKSHNMVILPDCIYIDAGISGRRAEKRPGFMRMIGTAKLKDRPFDVILVHKFDRFARNREDSIVYKSMLRKQCGVQVISITESIEDDRMGVIMEAMLEAMAEYYSINLGEEVRKGMAEKARRGELQATPPYGYQEQDHILKIIPKEAEIVREIYRKFLSGASMFEITRWSNRMGAVTHRGNPFDNRMVQYILSNPAYIGKLRWNVEKHHDRFSYGHEEEGLIIADGKHEPIIDEASFKNAEVILRKNVALYGKHARPNFDRKHWLAGIVSCANCGGKLVFAGGLYFKCGKYVRAKCQTSQHIRAEILEKSILEKLQSDADAVAVSFHVVRPSSWRTEKDRIEKEISSMEKKIDRLREAYINGADTVEEYKETKGALLHRIEELRESLKETPEKTSSAAEIDWMKKRISDVLRILMDENSGIPERYEAANGIIETCTWDKSNHAVEITYRLTL